MSPMASGPPENAPGDSGLTVGPPKEYAAGIPAVVRSLRHGGRQMGAERTLLTLLSVNQKTGFDCPGCAWPEGDHRHAAEFCENGAKAVAEEATLRRAAPAFFAEHTVAELLECGDYWLGLQGRLTHPRYLAPGARHYTPVSWEQAYDIVAGELAAPDSPDEASFSTSGRTSNEAAFAYQLFVRALGTNNLPDCSNMCHESSRVPCPRPSGSARAASRSTTCTRRTWSSSWARTRAEVDLAVAAARRAFDTGPWPQPAPAERGRILLRIADLLEERREELAPTVSLEMGKPITDAYAIELRAAINTFRWYGQLAVSRWGRPGGAGGMKA